MSYRRGIVLLRTGLFNAISAGAVLKWEYRRWFRRCLAPYRALELRSLQFLPDHALQKTPHSLHRNSIIPISSVSLQPHRIQSSNHSHCRFIPHVSPGAYMVVQIASLIIAILPRTFQTDVVEPQSWRGPIEWNVNIPVLAPNRTTGDAAHYQSTPDRGSPKDTGLSQCGLRSSVSECRKRKSSGESNC